MVNGEETSAKHCWKLQRRERESEGERGGKGERHTEGGRGGRGRESVSKRESRGREKRNKMCMTC
jgi:hypothetical protein